MVGSDSKAQSDIYSAVTLAGVVDTDCVVLAGPRDGDMPASQRTRLSVAGPGGYVLGGIAAVPTAKVVGRDMTRLGGATRWETAQLVGRRASGDTTAGTSTATESNTATQPARTTALTFTAVSAGGTHSCGLRTDGSVVCWGDNSGGRADAPSGGFTSVSASAGCRTARLLPGSRHTFGHSCGVRVDGSVACWGDNSSGQTDVPSGEFTEVFARSFFSCGARVDGSLACWGGRSLIE